MFVDGGGWQPPEDPPPPRKPHLTEREERQLIWIVCATALLIFLAPIGGGTVIQAVVALFRG